jgi:hypothetical protein
MHTSYWCIDYLFRRAFVLLSRTWKEGLYRTSCLKRRPTYWTRTPSSTKHRNQWQYWILAAVSHRCSWCTALNRHDGNFSCFVAGRALVTIKRFLCPETLLPVGVQIENWFCSWIHFCIFTAFTQPAWAVAWQPEWTWLTRSKLLESSTGGGPTSDFIFVS